MGDDFKVLDPEEHLEEKIHESVELNKKVKHETMNGDTILDVCNILHVTKVFLLFGRFSPTLRRHKNGKKNLQCKKKRKGCRTAILKEGDEVLMSGQKINKPLGKA